jgi:hypothetical protein
VIACHHETEPAELAERKAQVSRHRWDIDARAGPAREALIGGHWRLLVAYACMDDAVEHPEPDVVHARELASRLSARAEHAEQLSSVPSSADIHASGRHPHADKPPTPEAGENTTP